MSIKNDIPQDVLQTAKQKVRQTLEKYLARSPYRFNPSEDAVAYVIDGLARNKIIYGFAYCPCRCVDEKTVGDAKDICPCAYHKEEIAKFGQCDCALFLSAQ